VESQMIPLQNLVYNQTWWVLIWLMVGVYEGGSIQPIEISTLLVMGIWVMRSRAIEAERGVWTLLRFINVW
jgi:hypothetical protein